MNDAICLDVKERVVILYVVIQVEALPQGSRTLPLSVAPAPKGSLGWFLPVLKLPLLIIY